MERGSRSRQDSTPIDVQLHPQDDAGQEDGPESEVRAGPDGPLLG